MAIENPTRRRGPKPMTWEQRISRFWSYVRIGASDQCWEWTRSRVPGGYGQFALISHRPIGAHRVAWLFTFGAIADGLYVLHRCDNPPCCNPAHLFLGTQRDNMHDLTAKRRRPRGDQHWSRRMPDLVMRGDRHVSSVLTTEAVRLIRTSNASADDLARLYGVLPHHIRRIRRRERWKHVS